MTKKELIMLQSLPLEIKILKSKQRIREYVDRFGADGVYISFSGGKDSTVLLDLVRSEYPQITACFIDTGLEYPELKEHVKTFDNVDTIRPSMSFKQVIEEYGYPVISKEQSQYIYQYRNAKSEKTKDTRMNGNKWGRGKISECHKYLIDAPFKVSDKCCDVMKKRPAKTYEKKTGKHPIIGTMAIESELRMSHYLKTGCNSFETDRPTCKPLGFWTEQDVLNYILMRDLKIPSVYGKIKEYENGKLKTTKCDRTGCVFCAYGCHMEKGENRYQRLEETHPQLHKYCIEKLGFGDVLDYIGINYRKDVHEKVVGGYRQLSLF